MIENILKQKGIKKVWLANQIGISQQLLNYYLRNGFPPKLEKLAKEKLN